MEEIQINTITKRCLKLIGKYENHKTIDQTLTFLIEIHLNGSKNE